MEHLQTTFFPSICIAETSDFARRQFATITI